MDGAFIKAGASAPASRPGVVLELCPGWYVINDDLQWILCTTSKNARQGGKSVATARLRQVAFIASTKDRLVRSATEKGAVITPAALAVIEAWPERFRDWRRQQDIR